MKSITIDRGFFWGTTPQGVRFGLDQKDAYGLGQNNPGIFSTATKINLVPRSEAEAFWHFLLKDR